MPRQHLSPDQVKHGTLTGYSWHSKHGETPCDDCREAKREHSRGAARDKRQKEIQDEPRKAAWFRACSRLAEKYPAEFREILLEEMRGVVILPPEDEGESDAMQ